MMNARERKGASYAKLIFHRKIQKLIATYLCYAKKGIMRPKFDSFGKRSKPILTTQLGRKFYCAKKKCLLKRHPCFWKCRLFMWRSVSLTQSPGYFEYSKHGLHFDIAAPSRDFNVEPTLFQRCGSTLK